MESYSDPPRAAASLGAGRPAPDAVLDRHESLWKPILRPGLLMVETGLDSADVSEAAPALGALYGSWERRRQRVFERWPTCTAVVMTSVGADGYAQGRYWESLWAAVRYPGGTNDQQRWGEGYRQALEALRLPTESLMDRAQIGRILMHTGVPTYCLGDLLQLIAERCEKEPGLTAGDFISWATAQGMESRLNPVDVPVRQFINGATDYARDIIDRCIDLLQGLSSTESDLDDIGLPPRFVAEATRLSREGALSTEGRYFRRGGGRIGRPYLGIDPFGRGVQVVLPGIPGTSESASWRVSVDGVSSTVQGRSPWPGASEGVPDTYYAIRRPARRVGVNRSGTEDTIDLELVDPDAPMLVFTLDGRFVPARLSVPDAPIWVLYPADAGLASNGELAVVIAGLEVPGWTGWKLSQIEIDRGAVLSLTGHPGAERRCRAHSSPEIVCDEALPGITTAYGSAVYGQVPVIRLPSRDGTAVDWTIAIRSVKDGTLLVTRRYHFDGEAYVGDIWNEIPRPALGAFDVTVRGPLGTDMRRRIMLAEGLEVIYEPELRVFTDSGLSEVDVLLAVDAESTISRQVLGIPSDRHFETVYLATGSRQETLVITPPGMEVLAPGRSVWQWRTAGLDTENLIADTGQLMVRIPGASTSPPLEVHAGRERVQIVDPGHDQRPDVTRYELNRIADTVGVYPQVDLVVPVGARSVKVATVRPRRLFSAIDLSGDVVSFADAAPIEGLSAVVYMCHAPWRAPLVLEITDGIVRLPAELCDAGPLRVSVAVDDPWVPAELPLWPDRATVLDASGHLVSTDSAETALSAFLADMRREPPADAALEHLWTVVRQAGDIWSPSRAERITAACVKVLATRADTAVRVFITGAVDGDLGLPELIASGLPAARIQWGEPEIQANRLWNHLPAVAALLPSSTLLEAETRASMLRQCGTASEAILAGGSDPSATAGAFDDSAAQFDQMPPSQIDRIWVAAQVVPQTLLDRDTRTAAARALFDVRHGERARTAAKSAERWLNILSPSLKRHHPALAPSVEGRRQPSGALSWRQLPALSMTWALHARLAARGNESSCRLESSFRHQWTWLARIAPAMVTIDLVLAELLLAAMEVGTS